MKWDKSIKFMRNYNEEGLDLQDLDHTHGNNFFLIYLQYNSPAFFISKRDVFYKTITLDEENVYYSYGSSVEAKPHVEKYLLILFNLRREPVSM
jgi:hypothetical protein